MYLYKIYFVLCSVPFVFCIKALNIERKLLSTTSRSFNFYLRPNVIGAISPYNNEYIYNSFWTNSVINKRHVKLKKSKVFNLFPVPVDGECLSNEGRRSGICLNVYECRLKNGIAKGDCSMGFGVCCIFETSCGGTISNNITYLVSPNFPSSMPNNLTYCKIIIQIMDATISQLRIDFNHFSLGQPNRQTGVCDGDVFNITGGTMGPFSLCGQNSGQHIYYDIDGQSLNSRKTLRRILKNHNNVKRKQVVEILFKLTNRFFPVRFWEIRVSQIPFSQRAPYGCLQYFTGTQGIIQTFNFADNGRHLANQNYRTCFRQESNMCSIMYQPCDDQSFKIGPTKVESVQDYIVASDISTSTPINDYATNNMTNLALSEATTSIISAVDTVEGSGEADGQSPSLTSKRPMRGGFDILSFFRGAFKFKMNDRSSRQFFTSCKDRITMPCIIEDFVGVGLGPFPGCEPVHCGNQFCSTGSKPCRIESTVTPFYLGVHFGDGIGKGSPEDNIGACIQYNQMQCL